MAKAYLGIDHGGRRIGLALADGGVAVARPLDTLPNDDQFKARLTEIIRDHDITDLVIGRPRDLNGNQTAQTRAVEGFADELKSFGRAVHLQDEALTSEVAGQSVARGAPKGEIDRAAAIIILQDYLNGL